MELTWPYSSAELAGEGNKEPVDKPGFYSLEAIEFAVASLKIF